jgi:hypothetical protein
MKPRSVFAGVAAVGAMLVAGAVSASANLLWCMDDPPVQVQTATGTNLTVNVQIAVPQAQSSLINRVVVKTVTAPDGAGGTLITVYASVPSTIPAANITAAVKKFKVTDSATVPGGGSTTLHLDVPAA